jgi:hypothetical protein
MRIPMALLLLAACGSGEPPRAHGGPPAAMTATPRSEDSILVATVEGRAVFGHCIAQQMARGAATREVAREECIAFELLAQEAERRGLATDPEVVDETRRMLVERIVEVEFESKYRSPEDMRAEIDRMLTGMPDVIPEIRTAAHALIKVDKDATPAVVEQRRKVAEQIHAALANETGLTVEHLRPVAERIAAQAGLTKEELLVTTEQPYIDGQMKWQASFVNALYAIPEVGRISPVTRTTFGWHVLLLAEQRPGPTRAEVEKTAFTRKRLQKFAQWVDGLVQQHGIKIEKFEKALEEPAP